MHIDSPYAPPKARLAEAAAGLPPSTSLAGSGRRVANLLLDWVFAWIFTLLCAFALGMALGALGAKTALFAKTLSKGIWANLLGTFLFTTYYVVFEASFGWTLAKLITGTRVVDERGCTPSFLKVLGRSLARNVPFEPFSFLGRTGIGWHDRWSGTRVVSIRSRSGPTLADSFKPDFRRSRPQAVADAPARPVWTPTDGPPAWCPNCEKQITATSPNCACGADFTSPDGWKPLAEAPRGGRIAVLAPNSGGAG